mmetsp:Transcript_26730/g.44104  ORF Transcript_26730/g.44104 Transcript_26730/m.44104 type:complete len:127 (-) Transcript_26730:856-1236(-)
MVWVVAAVVAKYLKNRQRHRNTRFSIILSGLGQTAFGRAPLDPVDKKGARIMFVTGSGRSRAPATVLLTPGGGGAIILYFKQHMGLAEPSTAGLHLLTRVRERRRPEDTERQVPGGARRGMTTTCV